MLPTFLNNCGEYGGEFVGFGAKVFEFCGGDDAAFFKEFEPVGGFLDFAERVAALGDELRAAACAMGFAVVRTNRGARAQKLLAQYLRLHGFGKRGRQITRSANRFVRSIKSPFAPFILLPLYFFTSQKFVNRWFAAWCFLAS